jgi:hypothetical protein
MAITPPIQTRLTPEDLRKLDDLRHWVGLLTRAATLRYCVDAMHDAIASAIEAGELELVEPQAASPHEEQPELPEISGPG